MSKSVVIAGIGKKHCGIPAYRPGMEIWGINDCYQHMPEVRQFYKIFNIHKAFPECIQPKRFRDWRKAYDRSKALIITAKDLGLKKQRVLDITKTIRDNPEYTFCSSVSYAIFEAVNAGYDEIRLYRVSLNAGEYDTQGLGIIKNILWAQRQGVKVYWPWYKEVTERFKNNQTNTNLFYGETDINMQYGESNAVDVQKVSDESKDVQTVPITLSTPEDMKPADIKKAILELGGTLPDSARPSKQKLISILNELTK